MRLLHHDQPKRYGKWDWWKLGAFYFGKSGFILHIDKEREKEKKGKYPLVCELEWVWNSRCVCSSFKNSWVANITLLNPDKNQCHLIYHVTHNPRGLRKMCRIRLAVGHCTSYFVASHTSSQKTSRLVANEHTSSQVETGTCGLKILKTTPPTRPDHPPPCKHCWFDCQNPTMRDSNEQAVSQSTLENIDDN